MVEGGSDVETEEQREQLRAPLLDESVDNASTKKTMPSSLSDVWAEEASKQCTFVVKEGNKVRLSYDATRKKLQVVSMSSLEVTDEMDPHDMIGADLLPCDEPAADCSSNNENESRELMIYCYPRRTHRGGILSRIKSFFVSSNEAGHRYAHHRRFRVVSCNDEAHLRSLLKAIRRLFNSNDNGAKLYLVIINPLSGTRNAPHVYDTTVQPMLKQAGIRHDVLVTTHAGHARQHMQSATKNYHALIALGGDGILFEILQGLRSRTDDLLQRLHFGIIGSGTSNGLAKSTLHSSHEEYGVLESTFVICKGQTVPMDLSTVQTLTNTYTGFLTFTWAMIADIDIESECVRFLGVLRNDFWAVWRILWLRSYQARFSYLPSSDDASPEQSLQSPLPPNWQTIEGSFVLFWASQVTHAAYNVHQSPSSRLQDGVFQVMIIR